jgi:hypothetical protein
MLGAMQGVGQQDRNMDTISRLDTRSSRLGEAVSLQMVKKAFIKVGGSQSHALQLPCREALAAGIVACGGGMHACCWVCACMLTEAGLDWARGVCMCRLAAWVALLACTA